MHLSPDQIVFWHYGFLKLNATIVFTWGLMLMMAGGSKLITRNLSIGIQRSPWQNLLEIVVTGIEKQIAEVGLSRPGKYLGFLGTLFLFVAAAAVCTVIPGYEPPTASLSTTAALALCVFVAVPFFGSLLLRTSITVTGFILVARGHWERLLVCLLGFVMARLVVTRLTRTAEKPTYLAQAANDAP